MRLSNNQKFLIRFFLITSLTLLLKPNANAQAVQSTVFAYNDYGHNRHVSIEPGNEPIYLGVDISRHDEETNSEVSPSIK